LESILDTAISLDKMITSQPTDIHWSFEKVIDAENGEEDIVVICPALIKRGKSNGEDFDVEAMILPNEVMRADFKR
jgi:hypothetical protein